MARWTREFREYALAGAQEKLAELQREQQAILQLFPELQKKGGAAGKDARPARRRRTMSPAERKELSARMKKYWAARRTAEKK
jgi:hypothetical protein